MPEGSYLYCDVGLPVPLDQPFTYGLPEPLRHRRPLSAAYLANPQPLADKAIRALERKGFIVAEEVQTERDPLRAPAENLRVELAAKPRDDLKLNKPERELRAFLELHPGSH